MPHFSSSILKIISAACLTICFFITSCRKEAHHNDNFFRYNQLGGLETLDPAFAKNLSIMWGAKFIFNTLFEMNEEMEIVPSLCHNYTVSTDGLVYTFHLRTDVYFHPHPIFEDTSGRRMTSADVVYSLQRIIDPKVASSGSWIFNGRLSTEEPFKIINDSTFSIQLNAPFAPFLDILTMPYCSIVPKEIIDHYGVDFRSHPIGTGPFKFVHWEEGNALILHKHEKYWEIDENGRRLPYLDGVHVSFNEARSIELLLMLQGKLDFINGVDGTVKDILLDKNGSLKPDMASHMSLRKSTYLNAEFLGILMDGDAKDSILGIKKIRHAIDKGIDKKKLVTYYRNGVGIPAYQGFTPKNILGFQADTFSNNLDKITARKWVQEVKDSLNISQITVTLSTVEVMTDMCNFIANELKEIGINTQLQIYQASILRQMMSQNKLPFFKAQWIADYPNAETFMAYFYSKFPSPPNYTRTSIPALDALYNQALLQPNDSIRQNIYRQMDEIISDEMPVIPLFYDEMLHFIHPSISGFRSNALNIIDIKRVKKNI